MHLSLDLKEELMQVAELLGDKPRAKFIISTNTKDKLDEESVEVRQAFTKGEKALVIRLNEEIKTKTAFERIEHLYIKCMKDNEKYLALFAFLKLGIIEGKSLIFCNDIIAAYRIKLFLNKFQIKAFVLNPEQPKNQNKNLIHFFHIGQFDILILLRCGYPGIQDLQNVGTVFNFEAPQKYNEYKNAC